MRFIFAGMPLIALVAIFATNANQRIDLQVHNDSYDTALPEALAMMRHSKSSIIRSYAREQILQAAKAQPQTEQGLYSDILH